MMDAAQGWRELKVQVGLTAVEPASIRNAPAPTSRVELVCSSGALKPLSMLPLAMRPLLDACVISTSLVCAGVRLPTRKLLLVALELQVCLSNPPLAFE